MMYQPSILFIALRYIHGKTINKFSQCVYWISNISLTLTIGTMVTILSVMNGFEHEFKYNLLHLTPHVIITASNGYTNIQHIPNFISNTMLNDITYIKPVTIFNAILQSSNQVSFGNIFGIDPNYFEPLSHYLIYKNIYQLIPEKYRIIIGASLAQQLSVNINDQIRVTIPSVNQITPIGYLPSQRLFTVSDIYLSNSELDNYQVLMHQDDASRLMHYPPQCVTGWRIWLDKPFDINKFDQLNISKDWIWKDWREYKGPLLQAIKIEKTTMFLLFTLVIIVSVFNIIMFLILSIVDKKKEIAIFRTCGLSKLQVIILFIIQGMGNGFFGIICGSGLGVLLSKKLNHILFFIKIFPKTLQLPIDIQYFQIFNIDLMVLALIISIVLYPSWRMASINPAQVLNYD